ncbi:MAG: hypothetical protein QOI98_2998, partial [Solirubrobacteraceae bacterium]|nr:hypothetical protein [Solirubrobacteraceae bacterium]
MTWEESSRLEWLETNGLGGWASATVAGANTRRYHGLLVAATRPPVGRIVLLSKLDERVTVDGASFELSSNQYPGAIHPRGFEQLVSFQRDLFPVFEYVAGAARIRKTIAAIHRENTTVIIYESSHDVTLELRPFIAARDYHSLASANDFIRRDARFDDGVFSLQPYDGMPTLFISAPRATFNSTPDWYRRFEYPIEQQRGLDAHEDLFTPGTLTLSLAAGVSIAIIASTDDPRGRDGLALVEAERARRETVIEATALHGRLGRRLALAADQFIVRRGVDRKTIIAGYHWFTDWGRDAMISLPGLCLVTGRFDDARKILLAFAESVSEGMLPNCFPDSGESPEYNTVDATLWFFVAAQKYFDYTRDEAFARDSLLPVLRDILAWHERGTRHGIRVDTDGLLRAGDANAQLTWMDARIGDVPITPRHGKPVEINALWFNALKILSSFEQRWGNGSAALIERTERVRVRFVELFRVGDYLCDVVDRAIRDTSVRPNQIFAISLPHPLIDGELAASVLAIVEAKLLTPFGLRSLAPDDPRFVATYSGGPADRDRVYHQG